MARNLRRSAILVGALAVAGSALLGTSAAAPGAAPLASAAPASHATFSDPAGDSGAGADVTKVQVGNDVLTGDIVIWIDTPNRTTLGPTDTIVAFLDSDLSEATGWPEGAGADFAVELTGGGSALLTRWDAEGEGFVQVAAPSVAGEFVRAEKSIRFSIHPRDLGGTRGFNFFILTLAGEDFADIAPDGDATWTFALRSGPLRLSASPLSITPRPARAGKPFTATIGVGRDDINETIDRGTVTCRLTIGGRQVRAAARGFRNGRATCRWLLPPSAKGQLRVSITVAFGGAKVTRTRVVPLR